MPYPLSQGLPARLNKVGEAVCGHGWGLSGVGGAVVAWCLGYVDMATAVEGAQLGNGIGTNEIGKRLQTFGAVSVAAAQQAQPFGFLRGEGVDGDRGGFFVTRAADGV